jgi:hypothetical protein
MNVDVVTTVVIARPRPVVARFASELAALKALLESGR